MMRVRSRLVTENIFFVMVTRLKVSFFRPFFQGCNLHCVTVKLRKLVSCWMQHYWCKISVFNQFLHSVTHICDYDQEWYVCFDAYQSVCSCGWFLLQSGFYDRKAAEPANTVRTFTDVWECKGKIAVRPFWLRIPIEMAMKSSLGVWGLPVTMIPPLRAHEASIKLMNNHFYFFFGLPSWSDGHDVLIAVVLSNGGGGCQRLENNEF